MREIEKHYMRYVAFTVFPRYFCYVPQSVLFGRFVEWNRCGKPSFSLSTMPKGLRTLRLKFAEPHLTHFGGMVLLQRFCNKLRLRWRLQHSLKMPQRHANYLPCDLILALLYAIMAGLRRINKTEILPYNGTFLSLRGLSRFPDPSTLRRFLKRVSTHSVRQLVSLHDQLLAQLFPLPRRRTTLTLIRIRWS